MKELFLSFLVTLAISALGQRINPHAFEVTDEFLHVMETGNNLSNDTAIDIIHYHIDIEVALDSAFILILLLRRHITQEIIWN